MQCKKGKFLFHYLGLPLTDKKLPKTAFLPLILRIHTRLSGGVAKLLSPAGRIILTNVILLSALCSLLLLFNF
jgi:hypothetical protein